MPLVEWLCGLLICLVQPTTKCNIFLPVIEVVVKHSFPFNGRVKRFSDSIVKSRPGTPHRLRDTALIGVENHPGHRPTGNRDGHTPRCLRQRGVVVDVYGKIGHSP
ncbi:hypothetical protein MLPF_2809 [Mycobacterium lepromatosis]|nr:hypothetical protein MLPF_1276 [Mycobacterium lepromatosis]UKN42896.1 hypothetical protein MLPF_2809 [Mycobacterium lepromatosis]